MNICTLCESQIFLPWKTEFIISLIIFSKKHSKNSLYLGVFFFFLKKIPIYENIMERQFVPWAKYALPSGGKKVKLKAELTIFCWPQYNVAQKAKS